MNSDIRKGLVSDIQRMSTHDGPGIRTTIFFKGCSLACKWCHNPETIDVRPQIQWNDKKCIGCFTCVKTCPNEAISFDEEGIHIDKKLCKKCGKCTEACPAKALIYIGKMYTVDELMKVVEKDSLFYKNSDGGITVSGGEAALQAEFVLEFLKECKNKGYHTALDTAGMVNKKAYTMLLPYVDLVLYDIKEIDAEKHKLFTGKSNKEILKNILYIDNYITQNNKPELWIRTPLIPDATAFVENIRGIGKFIKDNLHNVNIWELCAFNNMCKTKYKRLEIEWEYKESELLTESFSENMKKEAIKSVGNLGIVKLSGLTAKEDE